MNGEKWIRMYPIPFRFLQDQKQYPKYAWVNIDLIRNTKDFRPESYRLKNENFSVLEKLGTSDSWTVRKSFIQKEVFTSMEDLIVLVHQLQVKALKDQSRDWAQKLKAKDCRPCACV